MNWFKKAGYSEFDWETVRQELSEKNIETGIDREPTIDEIREEILSRMVDDLYKEEPVHSL